MDTFIMYAVGAAVTVHVILPLAAIVAAALIGWLWATSPAP